MCPHIDQRGECVSTSRPAGGVHISTSWGFHISTSWGLGESYVHISTSCSLGPCPQVYQLSSLLSPLELRSLGEAADRFFATECSDRQAVCAGTVFLSPLVRGISSDVFPDKMVANCVNS